MNWKIITSIIGIGLLEWFSQNKKLFAEGVLENRLHKEIPAVVTTNQNSPHNLMSVSNTSNEAENVATKISGRFVMKGRKCAGFNFISPTRVTWTNEIDCGHPDTLKIRWLDNTTFFTQNIVQLNENCPPNVGIYKVVSFDGQHLTLKSIWTGWNDVSDAQLEFIKRSE